MTMTRNKNEKSGLSVASHLLFAGKLSTQTSDTITVLWGDVLLMMILVMVMKRIMMEMMLVMTRMLVMVLMMMKKMLMIVFISITT